MIFTQIDDGSLGSKGFESGALILDDQERIFL